MTHVHITHGIVEYKVRALLVDGVVGQVHEPVVQILGAGSTVLFGGKAGQSLLINKNAQGVNARDKHVDPEVELKAVDEVGLVHVALHHASIVLEFSIRQSILSILRVR